MVWNAAEHAYRHAASAEEPKRLVAVVVTELIDSDGRRAEVVVADFGVWRSVPASQGTRGRGLRVIGTLMESHDVDQRRAGTM